MIPVIVKGRGVSGAIRYVMSEGHIEKKETAVTYALMRAAGDPPIKTYRQLAEGEQSRATILGGQNFGFEIQDAKSLDIARRMMEWNGRADNQASRGRKCEVDCLHLMLNWEPGETPDAAEMREAATGILKALGMENAQAVFVSHSDKPDRAHVHIVASRLDPITGLTFSQKDDFSIAQAWGIQWDRAHGIERDSGLHKMAAMIERRDYAGLLDHFTKDRPTFIEPSIARALRLGGLKDEAAAEFRAELMAHPSLVALRDQAGGDVTRYTTRDVLKAELRAVRAANALAADASHGIDGQAVDRIGETFTLKPEQADAVRHLTGDQALAILWGEAGTGKSHTLKAVRAAYEEHGGRVIGLSWTNKVVQDMRENGFENYDTVARQLNALRKGRAAWDHNTVVVVDESAMLSSQALGDVLSWAARSRSKVILAGDDAQLASIEPGGLFGHLREQFGAATLTEVQRTKDPDQQRAFNLMHEGDFQGALEIFDGKGAILWTEGQAAALEEMAAGYAAAVEAAPDKSRFMFAYTNKDVAALNEEARALHRERGDLGEDVELRTAYGPQAYATGDRVQFTGNAWNQADRERGLVNGRVGMVEAVEIDDAGRARMTVALDAGREPQRVSFAVGDDARGGEFNAFKRGYAGTIYKGQGATLDESFVLADDKWRDSGAYVALSRHRDAVHVYTSRECFDDLADMARSFSRSDGKDAAIAYVTKAATLRKIEGELAAEDVKRTREPRAEAAPPAQPSPILRTPEPERAPESIREPPPTLPAAPAEPQAEIPAKLAEPPPAPSAERERTPPPKPSDAPADPLEAWLRGEEEATTPAPERPEDRALDTLDSALDAWLREGTPDTGRDEAEPDRDSKRARDRGGGRSR